MRKLALGLMAATSLTLISTPSLAQNGATLTGLDWSGRINAGGEVLDGNSQKKSFGIDGVAKARGDVNRYTVGGDINWAEDNGTETENDLTVYGEFDRFISDKMFTGARVQYETDDIANLDSRIRVGPYVGYQFVESDDHNLSTRLGLDYITEEFSTGDEEEDLAATWGVDYDQRFFNKAVQAFYKHDLSVPLDDTEGFLFESETGVRFPVADILTGTFQIDFDWDNAPAAGAQENDTKYGLKLGYEF